MWGERARLRGGRSVFPVGSGRTLPPRRVHWHRDTKEAGSERTGREEGPGTQGHWQVADSQLLEPLCAALAASHRVNTPTAAHVEPPT